MAPPSVQTQLHHSHGNAESKVKDMNINMLTCSFAFGVKDKKKYVAMFDFKSNDGCLRKKNLKSFSDLYVISYFFINSVYLYDCRNYQI